MSMPTPIQPISSGVNTTPADSSLSWRCQDSQRLHRDAAKCTDSPPSSAIIDTPSKRMRMEKRDADRLANSQLTTEPTPSRAHPRPQGRGLSAAARYSPRSDDHPLESERSSGSYYSIPQEPTVVEPRQSSMKSIVTRLANLLARGGTPPASEAEHGYQLTNTPGAQTISPDRIPETPVAPSSSPPLPRLTASNLSALNRDNNKNNNETNPSNDPTPSTLSIPSLIAAQISRLVLRCRINRLNHEAASAYLARVEQELQDAKEVVQEETLRSQISMRLAWAFVVLGLACLIWYGCDTEERKVVRAAARAFYGI